MTDPKDVPFAAGSTPASDMTYRDWLLGKVVAALTTEWKCDVDNDDVFGNVPIDVVEAVLKARAARWGQNPAKTGL